MFDIGFENSCATHVHIRPKDSEFSLQDLKGIWKGILYFEDALEIFNPKGSTNTVYAVKNSNAPAIMHTRQLHYGNGNIPRKIADHEIDGLFGFIDSHKSEIELNQVCVAPNGNTIGISDLCSTLVEGLSGSDASTVT